MPEPLPVSLPRSVSVTASSYQPDGPGCGGLTRADVVGAVASIFTGTAFGVSVLPALSRERYSTTWLPSSATVNGAL